ncbi:MAG TPA: hypothetical protein VLT33_05875, partial [Labilithrix sp.]|nr:hypothetical protein [Labilithrix sp.]
MARLVVAALSLAVLVLACNALTGAGDLGTCEGAACADLPGGSSGTSSGASGGPGDLDGSTIVTDGSMLPPVCTDGQKACEGQTAAVCVGTSWSRTPCSEVCQGGACVLWPSCRN